MEAKLYYPNMQNFIMDENGDSILCDGEGYLLDLEAWSEDYVYASARREELELHDEHWQVIYFIRTFHDRHGVQAPVRDMIKHFKKIWERKRVIADTCIRSFRKVGLRNRVIDWQVCVSRKVNIDLVSGCPS